MTNPRPARAMSNARLITKVRWRSGMVGPALAAPQAGPWFVFLGEFAGLVIGGVVLPVTGLTDLGIPFGALSGRPVHRDLRRPAPARHVLLGPPGSAAPTGGRAARRSSAQEPRGAHRQGAARPSAARPQSHRIRGRDVSKHGHRMHDRLVLDSLSGIRELVIQYDIEEVIIAIPRASPGRRAREAERRSGAGGWLRTGLGCRYTKLASRHMRFPGAYRGE
jgi:hypothetical protein